MNHDSHCLHVHQGSARRSGSVADRHRGPPPRGRRDYPAADTGAHDPHLPGELSSSRPHHPAGIPLAPRPPGAVACCRDPVHSPNAAARRLRPRLRSCRVPQSAARSGPGLRRPDADLRRWRRRERVGVSKVIPQRPALLADEDLPPPPRQARSIERRERLNCAALRQFGKQGYAATSLDDIAGEAGMPVGAVYLHYRSKRQLLLSLMNDLLTSLSELSFDGSPEKDPRATLELLLRRGFEQDLRYLGAYRAWREAVLT